MVNLYEHLVAAKLAGTKVADSEYAYEFRSNEMAAKLATIRVAGWLLALADRTKATGEAYSYQIAYAYEKLARDLQEEV